MEPYSPTPQAEVTEFLQRAVVVPKGGNQPHSIVFTSPFNAMNSLKASRECCITSSIRVADLEPEMIITASLGGTTPFFVGICYSGLGQRLDDFFEATARVITTYRQKTKEHQTPDSLKKSLATIWPKISFQKIEFFGVNNSACDGLEITIWKKVDAAIAVVPPNHPVNGDRDALEVALLAGGPCFK